MALTDESQSENRATNKDLPQKHPEKKEKPLTKVIIRRLPPNIQEDEFLNQISPLPDYDYLYMVRGDFSLGENAFARVYINFINSEDVFNFKERFDNYVFLDNKGHEYPAVVEYSAFQKIPKKRNKNKTDPKAGTIESDPYYLEFLESLNQQPTQEEKPEFSLQLTTENKTDTTTPLLEFVKQRRIERQRIKEERREERKRKEFERRKVRDDDRRKRYDERSPIKTVVVKSQKPGISNKEKESEDEVKNKDTDKAETTEKAEQKQSEKTSFYKNKERRFEDRKPFKPKYPQKPEKKDFYEKKTEYKPKKDEYKSKYYDDYKRDESKYTKKIKKYSERREERKNISKTTSEQKLEKNEEQPSTKSNTNTENVEEKQPATVKPEETKLAEKPQKPVEKSSENLEVKKSEIPHDNHEKDHGKLKDNDPRTQRRIRNKDRPTMAIYQPGMLSKRRQTDGGDSDSKDTAKSSTTTVKESKDKESKESS